MKRTLRSAAAVLAVALGVGILAPAPAYAADPLPPPVEPVPGLPSTTSKGLTSAGGIGDNVISQSAWLIRQAQARQAAGVAAAAGQAADQALATTVAKGVPITGTKAFASAAGGVLTVGFASGWMLTDGTLAMYGAVTGDEPMEGTCAQPEWAIAAIQVMYPFSAPSCVMTIDTPNEGVSGAASITFGGNTLTYLGFQALSGTSKNWCYSGTAGSWPGPGYSFQQQYTTYQAVPGVPYWTSGGSMSSGSTPGSLCGGTAMFALPNNGGPPYETSHILRVVNTSSGTVVATMTTGSADPSRIPSCQLTWPDGSVTTTEGDPYTEANGFPWTEASALCNDGFVSKPGHGPDLLPSEIEIGSTREDTGTYAPIQTQPVPEFTPDEKNGLTPGTSGGLVLEKVMTMGTSSCNTWDADCAGWWTATDSGTQPTTDTGTYRCMYNGSQVALVECGVYRNTFDTKTSTPTITDPATGEPVPWYTGTSPSTTTGPGTGAGACGLSWSWNPVDWVLNPLKCAFIPSRAKVEQFNTTMQTTWNASRPGQLATAVMGVSPALAAIDAGNCGGMIVPVPVPDSAGNFAIENHALLAACPGDFFAPVAPLFFWFISGSLVIAGFFAIKRSLDKFVGNA